MSMQTILGAGGAIGVELARALAAYTDAIRLVGRHPKAVNPSDELVTADLTRPEDTLRAVEGSGVVYLTVGLPYDTRVWQTTWPALMRNVIDACKTHRSRLVFFDNVYMYDPDHVGHLTEATPIKPSSKKGVVRAQIAEDILGEVRAGNLEALIARSADFYGPSIEGSSGLTEMVFKPLANGKKANWMGSVEFKHSFTYTPDAGRATALLGNTEDAYNQVWHLPTAADPPTGKEWIDAVAAALGVDSKYRVAPKFLVRIMGWFVPLMRELVEMMYQYDRNYVFDCGKFAERFDVTPTPYLQGIKEIVAKDYGSRSTTPSR